MFPQFAVLAVLVAYIVTLFGLAIRSHISKKTHTTNSKTIGSVLSAMSVCTSDMSSWLMMGLPAAFYLYGTNQIWIVIGLVVGSWLNWTFVVKKIKTEAEQMDRPPTIGDFLEQKLSDNTGLVKIASSAVILIFFTIYIASSLIGGAKLFGETLGLPYTTALTYSSVLIALYVCVGDFSANEWKSLIQGAIILVATICVPSIMFYSIMQYEINIINVLKAKDGFLSPLSNTTPIGIIIALAWGLGYFGQPHIMYSYKSDNTRQKFDLSKLIYVSWILVAMIGAALTGLLGTVFFVNRGIGLAENILISSAHVLMSPFMFGLIITAVLASIVNTANNQLVVCSEAMVRAMCAVTKKPCSQKISLFINRASIIAVIIIATLIASDQNNSIFGLVGHAWAGLGSSLGPVTLFSLYGNNISSRAGVGGIISGASGAILFGFVPAIANGLLPAFLLSTVTILAINRHDKKLAKSN